MSDRQTRISELVRKQRGAVAKPAFLRALSNALNRQVLANELIDLETTDQIRMSAGVGYQLAKDGKEPAFARYFSNSETDIVTNLVSRLGSKITTKNAFLLFSQSELCGAVAIATSDVFENAKQLLLVDGDGLTVVGASKEDGLLLDFNPDDEACCYELVVWGNLWPMLFLDCLSNF